MIKTVLVADIMTREPVTTSPETILLECARKMVKMHVGSLLLVKNKRLVGLISDKDILWALIKKSPGELSKIRAIDISPKKIATIKPTDTLESTLIKMRKLKFEKLPVIQNGELMGIITVRDILNFHPEIYPELEEFAKIREESEKLERIKKAKERSPRIEGMCEECGNYDYLYKSNGMMVCENCRESS